MLARVSRRAALAHRSRLLPAPAPALLHSAVPALAVPVRSLGRAVLGVGLASTFAASLLALQPQPVLPPLPPAPVLAPPSLAELAPRCVQLMVLFCPLSLLAPLAYLLPRLRASFYALLTLTLARAGPAFTKWGQWAATRPDLFPPLLCAALSRLHSSVPAHSYQATQRAVSLAFGAPVHELFELFEKTPVGSGSIAQVHRAVLRSQDGAPGLEVAVKVRHPGVEQRMRTDFAILGRLASALELLPAFDGLRVRETLAQFAHVVSAQVRLDCEGRNLLQLRRNFARAPQIGAGFPMPHVHYIAHGVLVESFEPGMPLEGAVASARTAAALHASLRAHALAHGLPVPPLPPRCETSLSADEASRVVRAGKEAYLQMLLVDNFIHADLHPGNILLRQTPGRWPRLTLVDAGMVDRLSRDESNAFVGLFRAMGDGDGRAAARALLACGELRVSEGGASGALSIADVARHAAFEDSLDALFGKHCRGFRTGADVGAVLRATLGALREHRVRLDGRAAAALVNLLCVESFAAALDPQYSLLDGSELLLRAHGALGSDALGVAAAAAAPALAALRAADELLTCRLPFVARGAFA